MPQTSAPAAPESERCVCSCGVPIARLRRRSWRHRRSSPVRGSDAAEERRRFHTISRGLEVHDIDESVHAPADVRARRCIRRLDFRHRSVRAGACAGACCAGRPPPPPCSRSYSLALLGEAVFIHYFPSLADAGSPAAAAPAPLRCPRQSRRVPIPADVTRRPPLPEALRLEPGAAPLPRE